MFDRYDPREDGRNDARDRGRNLDRCGRGGGDASDRRDRDARDVFTRGLDLPRGREREPVRGRDRVYDIDGSEARMLATVGSFRVVAEHDLHALRDDARKPHQSTRHLEDEELIRRSPFDVNDHAVVLTDRGRDLLEANRSVSRDERTHETCQTWRSDAHAPLRAPRAASFAARPASAGDAVLATADSRPVRAAVRTEDVPASRGQVGPDYSAHVRRDDLARARPRRWPGC